MDTGESYEKPSDLTATYRRITGTPDVPFGAHARQLWARDLVRAFWRVSNGTLGACSVGSGYDRGSHAD